MGRWVGDWMDGWVGGGWMVGIRGWRVLVNSRGAKY